MGLVQHGNGWRADFTKNGHRHKSKVLSKVEARAWETMRRGDIESGAWQPSDAAATEQPTLAQVLQWFGRTIVPNISSHPNKDISRLNVVARSCLGTIPVDQLETADLLKFIRERREPYLVKGRERRRKRKTIKEDLSTLNRAINDAAFVKEITADDKAYRLTISASPVMVQRLLAHEGIEDDSVRREPLSTAVQAELVEAAKSRHAEVYAFIRLALATGQRRGELLAQDWADVHIEDKWLWSKNKARKTRPQDKNREVPLSPSAREVLADMKPKKSGLMFPMLARDPDLINDAIDDICIEYGLSHITPHMLRHTCATRNQEAGVIKEKRMLLLGHRDASMAAHYAQAKPRLFADEFV